MNLKYSLVIFDLDGTLTDSGSGIISSVRKTLISMGRPVPPQDTLRRFIGPPTWDSFRILCKMSSPEAEEAVRRFRKIYGSEGLFDNRVYNGIPELLDHLRAAGTKLAVATSKPGSMAKKVLDHFGLSPHFDMISAADETDRGGGKEALISQVLKNLGVSARDTVMIGDTKFDASGAHKAGVSFVGVLYGFGTKEEIRRAGGSVFALSVADLEKVLFQKT